MANVNVIINYDITKSVQVKVKVPNEWLQDIDNHMDEIHELAYSSDGDEEEIGQNCHDSQIVDVFPEEDPPIEVTDDE